MDNLIDEKELSRYVASHATEIKEFINKKAETIIKQELRSAFRTGDSYYGRKEGYARKLVRQEVDKQIQRVISEANFSIDDNALREKINKSINSQLQKVKAKIEIEM